MNQKNQADTYAVPKVFTIIDGKFAHSTGARIAIRAIEADVI